MIACIIYCARFATQQPVHEALFPRLKGGRDVGVKRIERNHNPEWKPAAILNRVHLFLELSRSKCRRLPSGLLILEIDRLVQLRTVSATWYDVHKSLELSNECVPTVICCLRRAKQITIDVAVALCFNPVWCYEIVTVSHLGDTPPPPPSLTRALICCAMINW